MTPNDFFKIYLREPSKFIISLLEKQDVLTLQKIKEQCIHGYLRNYVIDAINHKLYGM